MNNNLNQKVYRGFLDSSKKLPNKTAVIYDGKEFSYSNMRERVFEIKGYITSKGIKNVAICRTNSNEMIELFLATILSGGCVYLLDSNWPSLMIRQLIKEYKPSVIFFSDSLRSEICDLGLPCFPEEIFGPNLLLDNDVKSYSDHFSDELFLLGFTSGSSGKPKAFVRNHNSWAESFRNSGKEFGSSEKDCNIIPGPLSHGISLYAALETLSSGGRILINSDNNPKFILGNISQYKANIITGVPSMLDLLCLSAGNEVFNCLKKIITSGSKLSSELRLKLSIIFPSAEIIEYYGASELSFVSVSKYVENCPEESVGRPFSGVDIEIRDPLESQGLPSGRTGLIWVRSKMICSGYVDHTIHQGFRRQDDWATVGDLGHLDDNGYLYIDGHEGSAIQSSGYSVYPLAIESKLLNHPLISDIAVVGIPDERWGNIIGAVVVLKDSVSLNESDLVLYCKEIMESYSCPRRWIFIDKIPLTESGKINRSHIISLFSNKD